MKMKNLLHSLAALAAVALLWSCSGVRDCAAPRLDMPRALAGNSTDSLTVADMEWWKFYSDSLLVRYIGEALANNRDVLTAAARVEEMRQLYGVERLNMAPTLTGLVAADNETNDYHNGKSSSDPEYDLKFTVAWEADLWGGLRWARRRGEARFVASVEQERGMHVTVIAEVASAYYRLMALDSELAIARRTLFTREENLKKARLRFEGGLTPETVYQQALVEYTTTASLIPGLERQVEVMRNALTLLLGRYPTEELPRSRLTLGDSVSVDLPVGLPSTLLTRRPDLRVAEANLRSALANAGVAYADRFPRLRISLTGGLENDDLEGFLRSPFSYVLGQVTGTILDFGRNKRKHKAAVAAYDQARLAYEQSVLNAFREVADARTTLRLVRESRERRRTLLEAAQKYATLAFAQYNAGVIAYIDVLDAQRRYYDAQVGLTNAVRDEHLAMVNLYRVLGGGWQSN